MSDERATHVKRHAPPSMRNRDPILAILRKELPDSGTVLEVASGSGEHALYFARALPGLAWQPSDSDEDALASIAAWRSDQSDVANLREPVRLDASATEWPVERVDAIVCINMVHISPPQAAIGLFAGAGRILSAGAPLVLYGPYLEEDVLTAPSNLAFDESLKARDPRWGLRDLAWIDELGRGHGLSRTRRTQMPANNLTLIYRHHE